MMKGGKINPAYDEYKRLNVFELVSFSPHAARRQQAEKMRYARASLSGETLKHVQAKCKFAAERIMALSQTGGGGEDKAYRHVQNSNKNVYTRDRYGLPCPPTQGKKEPENIIKRREFLKKLSNTDRNLLLSGDPLFQFDPVIYSCVFFLPKIMLPDVLNNHFGYAVPDQINHFNIAIGDNENPTSDSEESFNGFQSNSNSSSNNEINNDNYDEQTVDTNMHEGAGIPNTVQKDNATGASVRPNADNFNAPKNKNILTDFSLKPKLPCVPTSVLPPGGPSRTRSGKAYGTSSPSTPGPPSASSPSTSLLGRTGRMLGKLMDSHPLSDVRK